MLTIAKSVFTVKFFTDYVVVAVMVVTAFLMIAFYAAIMILISMIIFLMAASIIQISRGIPRVHPRTVTRGYNVQ